MHQEAKDLLAFMKGVQANPCDVALRKVFADWLEEHDEPEEARHHREFSVNVYEAEQYVRDFCKKYGANYTNFLTSVKVGGGYHFGDDDGPYEARTDEELRKAVNILLGENVGLEHQDYYCSC